MTIEKSDWDDIERWYREGLTLEEIGQYYNVSRERIRQILEQLGVSRTEGGQHVKAQLREQERQEELDRKCLEKYGCTRDQWKEMRRQALSYIDSPQNVFIRQKNNALQRGIEWELKLWDWWQIWERSGKWEFRGRAGDQYGLARLDISKGFTLDNVKVMTNREASRLSKSQYWRDNEKAL